MYTHVILLMTITRAWGRGGAHRKAVTDVLLQFWNLLLIITQIYNQYMKKYQNLFVYKKKH